MKQAGTLVSLFAAAAATALAVYGMAAGSRLSLLLSAFCIVVGGYLWFIQRDVNKKISGQGKR